MDTEDQIIECQYCEWSGKIEDIDYYDVPICPYCGNVLDELKTED